MSALALEEFSFRRHPHTREVNRLLLFSVLENFGYRQLASLWRVMALVDIFRRKRAWGEMQRKGLGESSLSAAE